MKTNLTRRSFVKAGSLGAVGGALGVAATTSAAPAVGKTGDAGTPAVLGGTPAHKGGWPRWPQWDAASDPELADVMKKGVWSRAKLVTEFENQWAKMIGNKHALAVVNGTNALSAAFMELPIGPGDEVIISPYTFSASIFGVLYQKAIPVFADIDPTTYQIDPEKIRAKITPRTKAILPVHICGFPSDMEAIMKIAKEHKLFVVEDACQAHLSSIRGRKVGSFGHAGCFSFQTSKIMPIGEGGAITTDDADFKDRLYSYHNYGYASSIAPGTYASTIHSFRLGNKIRMAEYQAAIGLVQLKKLEAQHKLRNENGNWLRAKLAEIPGIKPVRLYDGVDSVSYYMCPFIYDAQAFKGLSRDKFVKALSAEGVSVTGGYPNDPLYTQGLLRTTFESAIYRKLYPAAELNFEQYKQKNHCPKLIQTFQTSVWLNSTPMLLGSRQDMADIVDAVVKIQRNADKIAKA
ncbi:MAG: DegT/DnrJ/EryC1/StrS family aminotransferase [Verrucomicrobia bacterium]|nr:DegT/DnrJ/EryC1/StrS family aminotransferase [Verrucomicrobiota bacterium]